MEEKETAEPCERTYGDKIIEELSVLQKKLDTNAPITRISLAAETLLKHLGDCDISTEVGTTLCYSVKSLLNSAQQLINFREENEVWDDVASQQFSQRAVVVMNFTKNLLKNLTRQLPPNAQLCKKLVKTCVSHMIITCATHDTDLQWTSAASIEESKDLQSVLCNTCSVPSVRDLLTYDNPLETPEQDRVLLQETFSQVLKILQPKLTKAMWKREPICRHVYKSCLMQMKHPHLGQHLDMVLPPALLFTDDYQVHNKILGIECLCHIIKEVDATELRWHNRAGVIYAAVHSQIYSNKAPLLDVVLSCMLGILGVVEKSPKIVDGVRNVNRYDEVLQVLLMNMEGEQVIVLRRLYLKYVPLFIDKMGVTIVRHIKPLLRIITGFLEVSDGQKEEGRLDTLHLLNTLVQVAGPRLPRHTEVLLKALLKLLYDSCLQGFNSSQQVTEIIQNSVVHTMNKLQTCCYDVVNWNLKQVIGSEVKSLPKFIEYVKQVVGVSSAAKL